MSKKSKTIRFTGGSNGNNIDYVYAQLDIIRAWAYLILVFSIIIGAVFGLVIAIALTVICVSTIYLVFLLPLAWGLGFLVEVLFLGIGVLIKALLISYTVLVEEVNYLGITKRKELNEQAVERARVKTQESMSNDAGAKESDI